MNTGIAYSQLLAFGETLSGSGTGSLTYQLSRDNTNWYYHNGTTWVSAYLSSQSNTAAALNTSITTFHTVVGTGTLYVKAFLNSPTGAEAIELDQLQVSYVP